MGKRAKHKSVDKELKQSVGWLESLPCVNKVIIGLSECARHRYPPGHLRLISEEPGGFHVRGYGGRGVSDFFITVSKPDTQVFVDLFNKRYNP